MVVDTGKKLVLGNLTYNATKTIDKIHIHVHRAIITTEGKILFQIKKNQEWCYQRIIVPN